MKNETVAHPCFDTAAAHLAKDNTRLSFAMEFPSGAERLVIQTGKIDAKKKGKPKMMLATYCPFCGAKYVE